MNSNFLFEETSLKDAKIITSFERDDFRGFFMKNFETGIYQNSGVQFLISEVFLSSSKKNVIRGMHFQLHEPQAKLVTVTKGSVYDVIVDLRWNSPTYKHWEGFYLTQENHKSLYIPKGFAHGFLSLEEDSQVLYLCDGKYDSETDTGICYNDKEINILWPIDNINACIVSERDKNLLSFHEYEKNKMRC